MHKDSKKMISFYIYIIYIYIHILMDQAHWTPGGNKKIIILTKYKFFLAYFEYVIGLLEKDSLSILKEKFELLANNCYANKIFRFSHQMVPFDGKNLCLNQLKMID